VFNLVTFELALPSKNFPSFGFLYWQMPFREGSGLGVWGKGFWSSGFKWISVLFGLNHVLVSTLGVFLTLRALAPGSLYWALRVDGPLLLCIFYRAGDEEGKKYCH